MADTKRTDDMLESLFEAGRKDTLADPSPELMARVLQDAMEMQPALAEIAGASSVPRGGFLGQLVSALGGWPSVGGLVTAAAAGVWIGFAGADTILPNGVDGLVSGDTEYYLADLGTEFLTLADGG